MPVVPSLHILCSEDCFHELGTNDKVFIAVYLQCVQLGEVPSENERESCIGDKGKVLDRQSNVHRSTKKSDEEYEMLKVLSDLWGINMLTSDWWPVHIRGVSETRRTCFRSVLLTSATGSTSRGSRGISSFRTPGDDVGDVSVPEARYVNRCTF